jgi:hypothetical protein
MEDLEVPQGRTYSSSTSGASQWHPFGLISPYPKPQMEDCAGQQYSGCAPRPQGAAYSTISYTRTYNGNAGSDVRGVQSSGFTRDPTQEQPTGVSTLLVLRPNMIYSVTDYWVEGRTLCYVMSNGAEGSTSMDSVDWDSTADLNANRGVRLALQTNRTSF